MHTPTAALTSRLNNNQHRYPFTACEVFCCDVEAVFNTLLWEEGLMPLLFSFLDSPAPLSSECACVCVQQFGGVEKHRLLSGVHCVVQRTGEHGRGGAQAVRCLLAQ